MNASAIDEAVVLQALRNVIDPELGCNIVDLGMIYGLILDRGKVTVQMTLTSPDCPMHESLAAGAQAALLEIEGVDEARIALVWDPPWNPDMMTPVGRALCSAWIRD